MAGTLTETLFLAIRRMFRARLRRSYFSLVAVLVLLLFTFYLMSFLPSGAEKQSENSHRVVLEGIADSNSRHQELVDLAARNSYNKAVQDQIPKAEPMRPEDQPQEDLYANYYGDRFARLTENLLGNYEIRTPLKKGRPGDQGSPYRINNRQDVDWARAKSLKSQYGMNIAVSEFIPMDRTVPDLRLDECKHWQYTEKLPSASIVIVFHNEGLTTLMRTVHSVLVRSPKKFVQEVILVDDFSDKKPLKKELEQYIERNFGPYQKADLSAYGPGEGLFGEKLGEKIGKVRLIRNSERGGLIRSRSRGAREAVGDVIIFLDAHCEVNYNWLPPLLAPIARNRKTLTVPIIDGIDSETFEYRPVYGRKDQHYKGIWEWGMYYKEIEVDMKEHLKSHKVSEPYDAPTHAGGLFAIDRKYFLELGTYDPGLLVWGGENFELSFKVWQCGGRLQWVPCSRVGHVYRPFMPYSFGSLANKRKGPLIITNYKRVIEVWWDKEYKDFFYTREPLAVFYETGDISEQLAMKERLQCKSFDYFMERVGKDVYKNFPKLPANLHWGELRSELQKNFCVDTVSSAPPQTPILSRCHGAAGNQLLRLNAEGQLGVGERCVDASNGEPSLIYCKLGTVNGPWEYEEDTKRMLHRTTDQCLEFDKKEDRLRLTSCNDSQAQKFIWKKIRPHGY